MGVLGSGGRSRAIYIYCDALSTTRRRDVARGLGAACGMLCGGFRGGTVERAYCINSINSPCDPVSSPPGKEGLVSSVHLSHSVSTLFVPRISTLRLSRAWALRKVYLGSMETYPGGRNRNHVPLWGRTLRHLRVTFSCT